MDTCRGTAAPDVTSAAAPTTSTSTVPPPAGTEPIPVADLELVAYPVPPGSRPHDVADSGRCLSVDSACLLQIHFSQHVVQGMPIDDAKGRVGLKLRQEHLLQAEV